MRWITAHWELKVVAGVLAIALWVYTSGQVRVERTVTVVAGEAPVKGLGVDHQVVQIRPREFKVRLSLPMSRQGELEVDTIIPRLEVSPDQAGAGTVTFPLTSALLRLSNDIRIETTEPALVREIEVQVDRVAEGLLPVEPPRTTGLADGLAADIALESTLVRVQAPSTVLERLQAERYRVRFQDLPLSQVPADLAHPRVERCTLVPVTPPVEATYRLLQPVQATITVRPLEIERRTLTIPLAITATPEWWRRTGIELTEPLITLTVRGPRNLLRDLRPEREMTATVVIPDDQPVNGMQVLPVQVLGPAWLEHEPTKASLALSRSTP